MNCKIIDCITFFDNNLMFDLRYNILKDYVDYFVICESKFDHKNKGKNINFELKDYYDKKKIRHIVINEKFPENNNVWENQASQRDYIINNLSEFDDEDFIFFSDPDEIPNPNFLKNFNLKKRYGIFFQKCFNYKFNLFNKYESPWEGTRVCKKKNLKSIDYMRQKVLSKNLNYSFFRLNKEKNIEIFKNGGWHFNNIMSAEKISLKLKTFAHKEYSSSKFSDPQIIQKKIDEKIDLFDRGYKYKKINLDSSFPEYLINNKLDYKEFII